MEAVEGQTRAIEMLPNDDDVHRREWAERLELYKPGKIEREEPIVK